MKYKKRNRSRRLIIAILLMSIIMSLYMPVLAASPDVMTIHAIWLGDSDDSKSGDPDAELGGDAVLLESAGQYLLMDTGSLDSADYVVNTLKELGVSTLSVYISHTHLDHRGALPVICEKFNVQTIYLPSKSYGVEYPLHNETYKKIYGIAKDENAKVKELKVGSAFTVGKAELKIIGPVGNYKLSDFENADGIRGPQQGHYLNNYSLSAMVTCGSTKYLATGDIEQEEERALLKNYGAASLKADIYKMAHHGLATSNTADFLAAVKPTFAFALNSGYTGLKEVMDENGKSKGKYRKTFTARKNVSKYGMPYMVGDERRNLVITVTDNKVKLYRGAKTSANQLKGWVSVQGADGVLEKTNKYYLNTSGVPLKGVQIINGKYYYLGTGGCLEKGYYNDEKNYVGWRTYGPKIRYYLQSGEMAAGFWKVNGTLFYFSKKTGYRKEGSDKWPIVTIGSKKYTMSAKGAIYTKGWKKDADITNYRYFDKNGVMQTKWLTLDGVKYYLNSDTGLRTLGLNKISDKFYYFNTYGKLQINKTVKIDGKSYKTDSKGVIAPPKVSQVSLTKVKAGNGSFKLSWESVAKAKGYAIVYARDSKFTKSKTTVLIKDADADGKPIGALPEGKTYYVKVRAYKMLGSYKVYGPYSPIKTITVK